MVERTLSYSSVTSYLGLRDDPDYAGVRLEVRGRTASGLMLENFIWPCLRLSLGGKPVLWARVADYLAGIWLLRRRDAATAEVVPPINAETARCVTSAQGWMKWFARGLYESSRSPLYDGSWQLSELRGLAPGRGQDTADAFRTSPSAGLPVASSLGASDEHLAVHYESWMPSGFESVITLRQAPSPDAGRVKAWRKHARGGTLPPVLLWWVSPFDRYVLLDGHDRLVAAELEGVRPQAIELWAARDVEVDFSVDWRADYLRRYEKTFQYASRMQTKSLVALNKDLTAMSGTRHARDTRARVRFGQRDVWLAGVARELEGHPELLLKFGIHKDEFGLSLEESDGSRICLARADLG